MHLRDDMARKLGFENYIPMGYCRMFRNCYTQADVETFRKAVRDYDCGRDASFRTFAQLCVNRQLYTAIKASNRKKHLPLNSAISLSQPVGENCEEGSEEVLADYLEADNSTNPEEYMIGREESDRFEEMIEKELSPFEKQVLELHLTGMGYVEIAHVLNRDEKSADNALQRIRTKFRKWR